MLEPFLIISSFLFDRLNALKTNLNNKHENNSLAGKNTRESFVCISIFFRPTLKPGAFVTGHQSVVITKQETVITRSGCNTDSSILHQSPPGNDIDKLHAKIHPTDVELLYSRLPADVLPNVDYDQPLSDDQQLLHARLIASELERENGCYYQQ